MSKAIRFARVGGVFLGFGLSTFFALNFRSNGFWQGVEPALAGTQVAKNEYDLTRLEAVNETLKMVRDKYVDPERVKPKEMLLAALNEVQREIAQVIVVADDSNEVTVRVENQEKKFRTDNVLGPWDVSARLREVFGFLQKNLKPGEVDLRQVEYAACNGMLHVLDPHSVFLSPEGYKEMSVSTSGAFGGLGLQINIQDGQLTVVNPMPETPASEANIKKGDRIVQINNESTVNMPIDDAVRRLRGEPGTQVNVWIVREGEWKEPKNFQLTRRVIKVKSVDAKLLDGNVGYIKLKGFQQSSSDEVQAALDGFRAKGALKGVVLDLRGNPGGLLDQAAKIADKFIEAGTLVATVGASEGRKEEKAQRKDNEPGYPLVVLVSATSASASEIVAGALKNLDRALIVGQTTFGKGSVQLIFPEITPDKAALKLTIAQYLTPGDVSIQGVGVTPDIELDPMTPDELEMDLTVNQHGLRERDLTASLSNSRAAAGAKPQETLRYHWSSTEREAWRTGTDDEAIDVDFPIRFARELASRIPMDTKRLDALKAVKDYVEQARKDELAKVTKDLEKLGVDWSDAPDGASNKPELEVKIETDRAGNEVKAGESLELRVTVKNNGKQPIHRLRGVSESDNSLFDQRELVFGKIGPGQSKTAKAPLGWCDYEGRKGNRKIPKGAKRVCNVPLDTLSRSDGLSVKFEAAGLSESIKPVEIRPTIRAVDRPSFAYSLQFADDRSGNGDGRLQKGERVTAYLTIKNVGKGKALDTQAALANLSGDALLLQKGRFDVGALAPGDTKRVAFTFDVAAEPKDNELMLQLSVGDRELREYANEKVKIPLEAAAVVAKASGVMAALPQGAALLPSPGSGVVAIGTLGGGAVVSVLGTAGDYTKVQLDGTRFAFVSTKDLQASQAAAPAGAVTFADSYSHAPPLVEVGAAALFTREDKIKITGTATGSSKLLDVYAFVGDRKTFYKSNRDGADPKKLAVDFEVPLRPGVNYVTVFARESTDSVSRRTLIIRKDGPDGAILKTPKADGLGSWLADAGD